MSGRTGGPASGQTAPTIPGVRFGRSPRAADSRGAFLELWRASTAEPGADPFVQANLSVSSRNVLRGLHFHRRQLDRWLVASGSAFVALVDVRPMLEPSSSSAPPIVLTRRLSIDEWVEIPAGVAHGFLALEPLELVYFVTNEYDGTDELGFAWDDPQAAVAWPAVEGTADGRPILSERDQANPSLAELVERLRA